MEQKNFLEIFPIYLVFIPAKKYIKYFSGSSRIESWKSNGMSEENIEPTFVHHHLLPEMNFNGHCLVKNNISIPKKVINPCICFTHYARN